MKSVRAFAARVWDGLTGPFTITLVLVLGGAALWYLSYEELDESADRAGAVNALAASLLTGAIVSGAFVVLERRQSRDNERQALRLQLSFTANLNGIDLRDEKLDGIYLGGKVMRHANFQGARLAGASFFGSDLTDAVFTDADLTGADFSEATITRALFNGAVITSADFSEAKGDKSAVFVGAIDDDKVADSRDTAEGEVS